LLASSTLLPVALHSPPSITTPRPPPSPLFPYTTLFGSAASAASRARTVDAGAAVAGRAQQAVPGRRDVEAADRGQLAGLARLLRSEDTRLNSSHQIISYAVFCLKKKKAQQAGTPT